jgi:hypothetical protein
MIRDDEAKSFCRSVGASRLRKADFISMHIQRSLNLKKSLAWRFGGEDEGLEGDTKHCPYRGVVTQSVLIKILKVQENVKSRGEAPLLAGCRTICRFGLRTAFECIGLTREFSASILIHHRSGKKWQ